MKLLDLDDAEENLLAWLIQCCLSDGLLAKSGLAPDLAGQYLAAVRTLDAKLMEIAVRSGDREVPECGEVVGELPGIGVIRCTRPRGHAPGRNGKAGHIREVFTGHRTPPGSGRTRP